MTFTQEQDTGSSVMTPAPLVTRERLRMPLTVLEEDFTPLTLAHAPALGDWLKADPQPLSGYTAATLCAWNEVYHYAWMRFPQGPLLLSCHFGDPQERHLLMPVGGLTQDAQTRLLWAAGRMPYPLKIFGVTQRFLEQHPNLVERFDVTVDAAGANYIYSAQDLAELPGRKFHQKRNLVAQAAGLYPHVVEPLHAGNLQDCLTVLNTMDAEDGAELTGTLAKERLALLFTLRHFMELQQQGLLLRIEGTPVAFTIFEGMTPEMAVVHFEKARRSFKGLYQVINQAAAKVMHGQGFTLINREEDLGNEGLRRAKLSYNPVEVKAAHVLTYRGQSH